MGLHQRVLACPRAAVDLVRVADLAHRRHEARDRPRLAGGQVPALLRVGLQVEQLRLETGIADELPPALPQHEAPGGGPCRMIFAEHGALRLLAERPERAAGQRGVGVEARAFEDRRVAVQQRGRRAADPPRRHARPGGDQRHADRLLIHVGLAPEPARAEVLAMVAGVDDARRAGEPGRLQRGQHATDIVVEEGAEPVVGGDGHPARLVVEEAVIGLGLGIGLDPGMARAQAVVLRQRHLRRVVEGEEGLGRDQREMRADEGDEQHPRAVRSPGVPGQPAHRLVRDRPVVAGVAALAGAELARELRPAEADGHGVLDRAVHVAPAVHDMHRANLGVEAGRVRLVAVVQLADGEHRAARRLQRMAPAGRAAVIGVAVVPGADLVDMAPGGD